MKKFSVLMAGIAAGILVTGCSVALAPGDHEGDTPPRMVVRDSVNSWDNGAAFGPVPAALLESGKRVCSGMNTADKHYKPVGYHSRAQDLNGNPIAGGGFLCVREQIQAGS